jgi:hypothetical protein
MALPLLAVQAGLAKLGFNFEGITAVFLCQQNAEREVRRTVVLVVCAHVTGPQLLEALFLADRHCDCESAVILAGLRYLGHAVIKRKHLLLAVQDAHGRLAQM